MLDRRRPGPAAGSSADAVILDVPARARSLRLLRMAVADAAGDLDMDLDAIEAARIAVDELATLLLATAGWERLVVRIDHARRRPPRRWGDHGARG